MKFSLKWLGDYIDISPFIKSPQSLVDKLTQAGLEVDAWEDQKSKYQNIIIAQIESVKKHPSADRLTLCEVKDDKQSYSIVCGAKNHKADDKVILAKPGAVLPGDIKIKKTRIRGIDSEGMLASSAELGFPDKGEGIWILPDSAPLGKSFSEYKDLDDVLFDIVVPPNRSDCLSHKGLAREMSCIFSVGLKNKEIKNLKTSADISIQKSFKVEVKDSKACPRYCARLITGVEIKESPQWLKKRLESIGLKSINNIVDVTNFILWDMGQPLHAFDRDKIHNIEVSLAKQGESFLNLDDKTLTLTKEDVTIRDNKRVLALAGVIGGMDSSINSNTKNVVIESAFFAPEKIRKSTRRFGIETDSSYRFTRGVDAFCTKEAMDTACRLIQELAGGVVSKDFYDFNQLSKKQDKILISTQDVSDRLAYPVSSSSFEKWMKNLACQVSSKKDVFEVIPPSYRLDLKIKEDLIEEFARLESYDKISETLPPSLIPKESDLSFLNSNRLVNFLSGRSWSQALNYSFCDPKYYEDFLNSKFYLEELLDSTPTDKKSFSINNPISQQMSLMKTLLTPDLFRNISHNLRRNNKLGQIFELSPIFQKEKEEFKQELHLALGIWGVPVDIWDKKAVPNFYKLKDTLSALFSAFQFKALSWERGSLPFLHPKQTLILNFKKKKIGFVGSLHPNYAKRYKTPVDIALAEVDWTAFEQTEHKSLKFKKFSKFLTLEKDLCFIVPFDVPAGDVQKEIKKSLAEICQKVDIFDIYEKSAKRFVSFRIYLTSEDKSWKDEELQGFLNRAIQAVDKKFSIQLKP